MEETPEKYLISMAKKYLEKDKYMAKAWLLTATTLFHNNFPIQFEAYEIEKGANNCKEAAKCLRNLFRQFPTNERLWREIQLVVSALRNEHPDENQLFLINIYNHLPPEVQHEMLLITAEHSDDTMEHCRLMLLLLNKFPTTISQHGGRLVDLLVSAEKHEHEQAVNCYRKLLVCDLLPLLGATTLDLPTKQLFKLLHKSIEFYLCYVINRNKAIQDLSISECIIEEPWAKLFLVLEMVGRKLNWELSEVFKFPINKELVWQRIVQFRRLYAEQPKQGQQLLYCTLLLFLYCLHDYCIALDPPSGSSMVLVEGIVAEQNISNEPAAKLRKLDPEEILSTHWTVGDSSQTNVIANFMMAFQCWQLFYSCDYLEKEFAKLVQTLSFEPWLSGFLFDVTLYQGSHDECLRMLITHEVSRKTHLRLASTHYFLGQYPKMLDSILGAISCWSPHSLTGTLSSAVPRDGKKRHLHFLPLRRTPVLQYCCKLLIAALRGNMMHVTMECDLAMGHMLVLMQLDWPHHESLQTEIMERIRQRSSFTYALFTKYIVQPDIVDEFMLLSTMNVSMDILPPSSNQILNHRRISTRGVDKGAKEDFKLAMKRQVARSSEPIDNLIVSFLTEQRDLISHSLSTCLT